MSNAPYFRAQAKMCEELARLNPKMATTLTAEAGRYRAEADAIEEAEQVTATLRPFLAKDNNKSPPAGGADDNVAVALAAQPAVMETAPSRSLSGTAGSSRFQRRPGAAVVHVDQTVQWRVRKGFGKGFGHRLLQKLCGALPTSVR